MPKTKPKATLEGAQSAYRTGNYAESLRLAKEFGANASGVARDDASYLEGLSLLRQDEPAAAKAPLRDAASSIDAVLAAEALVSLGSAMIALEEYDDAARAYARAAELLEGEEAQRAHATAARCFARAGLAVESARESLDANSQDATAVATKALELASPAAPSSNIVGNGFEAEESPHPQSISDVAPRTGYTIQSGAFRDRAKAESIARSLRASAKRCGLPVPGVTPRVAKDGSALFAVQVGVFASHAEATTAMTRLKSAGATVVER